MKANVDTRPNGRIDLPYCPVPEVETGPKDGEEYVIDSVEECVGQGKEEAEEEHREDDREVEEDEVEQDIEIDTEQVVTEADGEKVEEQGDQSVDMPFLTRHYLLNYLWITAEATCLDFSNGIKTGGVSKWKYRVDWESEPWKYDLFEGPYVGYPEMMEMEHWSKFINRIPDIVCCNHLRKVKPRIAASLGNLRLSAVHRMLPSVSDLFYAMKFPQLVNDWRRFFEVEQVFMVAMNNPTVEDDTRRKVEALLYCPSAPDTSAIQVASHILRLQEETCFRWSKSDGHTHGCTTPEEVQFQNFQAYWEIGSRDVQPSPKLEDCDSIDGQLFSHGQLRCKATKDGRELRDEVSHRDVIKDWHIRRYAQSGIVLALLCNDRENALEIEIITEQWLTKASRSQVIARLRDYYQNHLDQHVMERKRHSALADILETKDKEGKTKYTDMYLSLVRRDEVSQESTPEYTRTTFQRQTEEEARAEYSRFDGYSKKSANEFYRTAVMKFVDCDSMHVSLQPFRSGAEIPSWMLGW